MNRGRPVSAVGVACLHSVDVATKRRIHRMVSVSLESKLQRRVQRYGWDAAAADYESLWKRALAVAQDELLARATLVRGERVLDVACGTGLVSFAAASIVGVEGEVLGIDLSGRMIDAARRRAELSAVSHVRFARMDAEQMSVPERHFDAALCALGLMYMPDPRQAMMEIGRALKPGGRVALAVWGERSKCGWSALFPIVDAEIASDVCPLFFRLGQPQALTRLCADVGLDNIRQIRINSTLDHANAEEACAAAFIGGPVALAWSRFDLATRLRVRERYLAEIAQYASDGGYRIPIEFVVVTATAASSLPVPP